MERNYFDEDNISEKMMEDPDSSLWQFDLVWKLPLFCFLSFLDLVATRVVMFFYGDIELNPVLLFMSGVGVSMLEVKLLCMSLIVFIAMWMSVHGHNRTAVFITNFGLWAYGMLCVYFLYGLSWILN